MTNAASNIKEIFDALVADKFTDDAMVFGVFGGGGGGGVIQNDGVHIWIVDALPSHALEDAINGRGVVMRQGHVWGDFYDLTRLRGGKSGFFS